MISVVSKTRHI